MSKNGFIQSARTKAVVKNLLNLQGERNVFSSPDELAQAGEYISDHFRNCGLDVWEEPVPFDGTESKNIFGIQTGTEKGLFIIGAHYDTVRNTPGADDNASAVSALLEIAHCLQSVTLRRSLIFCGFTLEEYGCIGSKLYAENLMQQRNEVIGMISLEMVGYRDSSYGSQTYPEYVDASRYPNQGDFIALVGNEPSELLTLDLKKGMKKSVPDLPIELLIVPGSGDDFYDVRLSDHSPFWGNGIPAVMITDTAFFRNPNYHKPSDTIDTLDFEFIRDVAQAVSGFLHFYLS